MTFICCLLSGTAYAECTPTPDCASIGYTETSCNGGFVRCPFDTSKLFCIPCDSSYKYDCNGNNITGSVGSACGGKYASCECANGTTFENGNCVCDTSCSVGAIYYSDKTCSACVVSGKTAIGVVVKDNELVMSKDRVDITWSNVAIDTSLTNMDSSLAKADMNGKNNTAIIVAEHPNDTTANNAAIYCNSYSTTGTSAGDWYLPAAGELYSYVYGNYSTIEPVFIDSLGCSDFNWPFWSSSELSSFDAFTVDLAYGNVQNSDDGKYNDERPVACFLTIK